MRRTGAKLTLSGAMGRQLDPLPAVDTNSASLAAAERQIKALKLENQTLKSELSDVRTLYKQLTQENTHERFDERRVTLLKSQTIQLERQVLLLTEAISSRGEVMMEVENALTWLADKCRAYIGLDVRGPQVNIDRSDLTLMVETAESARIKLYKQIENRTTDQLSKPFNFYTEFIHPSKDGEVTLLEIASGNLQHINLKHVTKLETKLSSLYKELIYLHASLSEVTQDDSATMWTSCHVTLAARERLMTQMLKTCAMMKDSTSDLLELSMLFPSAPWPPLKKCAVKEITADRVLQSLPAAPRSKSDKTQKLIQALVKAHNYRVYMLNSEVSALRQEVKYHQNVYNLQLKYTESLFQAIREGYSSFEETTNDLIVKPLKSILEAYVDLNTSASEKSLKKFLSMFKDNAAQLSDVVDTISVKAFEESEGSRVLSQYGEDFFAALEKLVKDEQTKRDREARRHEDLQEEQRRLDAELRNILEEQERREQKLTSEVEVFQNESFALSERSYNDSALQSPKTRDSVEMENKNEKDQRRRDSPPKSKQKKSVDKPPLHKKEWVNVFDSEESLSGLSLDQREDSEILTDKELMVQHGRNEQGIITVHDTGCDIGVPDASLNGSEMNTRPPAKPKKKKPNYVPNTFVPNRTLQLRRSGSLTKISTNEKPPFMSCDTENCSENKEEMFEAKPETVRRPRSSSRDMTNSKLPQKKKPAFR